MRLKLDLTLEQKHDLVDFFIEKRSKVAGIEISKVCSVEFISDETWNKVPWSGLFILHFGKAWKQEPLKFAKGSAHYSTLLEWFQPKIRDWKLEELGI